MELKHLLICIAVTSVIGLFLTVSDKSRAKKREWRVPEWLLIAFSLFGGSVVMYITMKLIRHKTRHAKFMVGIPIIIVLQTAAIILAIRYGYLVI